MNLKTMILEILNEELAQLLPPSPQAPAKPQPQTRVSITNQDELDAFVKLIANICDNPQAHKDSKAGKHTFTLAQVHQPAPQTAPQPAPQTNLSHECKDTLVTERYAKNLPEGTSLLTISANTRISPLAQDLLRQKKIAVKRMKQNNQNNQNNQK